MKTALKPGTRVKVKLSFPINWANREARVTDYCQVTDWLVPGYLGEGFYMLESIPDRQQLIAHEDDLTVLTPETTETKGDS